ncbi:DsbA family protein [Staphylococcus pseudoxylosus]|uniref:DsbA family protein n=1 Tax=Staphylococcus pseudoxylosus TaxID=2282419 RepID=UPI000D1DFFE3|nr:DsbA family protein [Staphylococcus pseudoxylosus]PTI80798.1 protein-disulfide isomerase [Staphylococcus xylosus]MDW8545006.1 DsbA family protein [Staphylococcus pseudoxylosus]MEB5782182.1 DsbA family protein [Staphylococcus pseudoxylosus]MEB6332743.1 DsbA family protein [Staphylococcus pseudoxylosus]RQM83664.1 protein-disulfide isomerase [Staphylococcus xylosus]
MKKLWLCMGLVAIMILVTACSSDQHVHKNDKMDENGKIKIIEYGDFKCPYCKKVETNVMPKLKKEYIDQDKVDYQFVNMAFLGDDSIIGSRAGHAVQHVAPDQYLTFQKLMFEQQPDSEKEWINKSLVDNQIDKLPINQDMKDKIKKEYTTTDSKSWKAAKKDQQQAKENHVETAPTVYVGGEKLEDPYKFKNYKEILDK